MKTKKWTIVTVIAIVLALLLTALTVFATDPYFHFHGPLPQLDYRLGKERYINDGISKFYEYDAIITGTSVCECFKNSEFDELFGTNSVKLPYSGGGYKEIDQGIRRAFSYNSEVKTVLRGLDFDFVLLDKDWERYSDYPEFLYDSNHWNDVKYVLNKDVLIDGVANGVVLPTLRGTGNMSMDDYAYWDVNLEYGKQAVMKVYNRPTEKSETQEFTQEDMETVKANFTQNIIETVNANPDKTFYLFYPPDSILYFDKANMEGRLAKSIEAMKYGSQLLLECDNIKLFCFFDETEMITNLDNYKDYVHYSSDINSQILKWIAAGEHQLTKENVSEYFDEMLEFYCSYNYDELFN